MSRLISLLDPQRGGRLEARRAACRNNGRNQRDDGEEGDRHAERHGVSRLGAHEGVLQQPPRITPALMI